MKNEIDNKQILAVYERIQQRGEVTEEGKFYQGITAFSDIDGYTVYLQTFLKIPISSFDLVNK